MFQMMEMVDMKTSNKKDTKNDDSEENKDKPKLKFQRFYPSKKIIVLDPKFKPGKDAADEGDKDGEGDEKEKEEKLKN